MTPQDWSLLCHCVHSLELILLFQRGTCVALEGRTLAIRLAVLSDSDTILFYSPHTLQSEDNVSDLDDFDHRLSSNTKPSSRTTQMVAPHQNFPLTSSKICNVFIPLLSSYDFGVPIFKNSFQLLATCSCMISRAMRCELGLLFCAIGFVTDFAKLHMNRA